MYRIVIKCNVALILMSLILIIKIRTVMMVLKFVCYVLLLTIVMLITNRDDTKPSLKSRRGKVAGFIKEPAGLP